MKTVLCFGDSNTWGYDPSSITLPFPRRHPLDVRWTGILARELGTEYRVIEEGQNGRTTVHEDPLNICRKGKDYLPACLESHKPIDLVVMMLGTNDLKSMFNMPPGEIANSAALLSRLILASDSGPANRPPRLLLVCPPQVADMAHLPDLAVKFPDAAARSGQFPRFYEAIASALGCAYLDSQEIVKASPIDALHLEAEEHLKLGLAIADKVKSLLT